MFVGSQRLPLLIDRDAKLQQSSLLGGGVCYWYKMITCPLSIRGNLFSSFMYTKINNGKKSMTPPILLWSILGAMSFAVHFTVVVIASAFVSKLWRTSSLALLNTREVFNFELSLYHNMLVLHFFLRKLVTFCAV